jgi:RimJ/RimL family protein N-acetyltransferase
MLETERLLLRHLAASDLDDLVALDSDPEVMRNLTDGQPTPRAVMRERLPRILAYAEKDPNTGFFAAILKSSGSFIGWFHLRPCPLPPHDMELGYRLMRSVWGQGYATEGGRALLDQAFGKMGLERVIARTLKANLASRRVMEKLGMRYESTFLEEQFPGVDKAAVMYAIQIPVS